MPLTPGTRLGPYEIVAPLGAGGMGEVYKGRDTRLDRSVAIKVLPANWVADPERRQRFEREAKAISSLNHPNICALYDVGDQDGMGYLVMEHLDGENLADRLARGPLPPDQLLRYAIEAASALDQAHRHGVVHRDLKPANIMITKAGIKLLDFGLAKMREKSDTPVTETLATRTQALTTEGTLVGTFQYMAPEQLEGKEADVRTDIFAFGAVLYEMATARRAFEGKTQASVIAAILAGEPAPMTSLEATISPAIDHVVRTCLAKDPDERRQSMHDVLLELKWAAGGSSQTGALPVPAVPRRSKRERLIWIAATAVLLLATLGLAAVHFRERVPEARPVRFTVLPPDKVMFGTLYNDGPAVISPDGQRLAFVGVDATGSSQLWVRPLESLTAQPLPGTKGATYPFWSPNSKHIAFFADGKLKKIAADGGPPQPLCEAQAGRGGSWAASVQGEGTIVFAPASISAIFRVPASGGEPVAVTRIDTAAKEATHRQPEFLPDGRHFFYVAMSSQSGQTAIFVGDAQSSAESQKPRRLMTGASHVSYTSPGYLLFVRETTLMAQPFDLSKMDFSGEPLAVAEQVDVDPLRHTADFSVANNGVLVWRSQIVGTRHLIWIDRHGQQVPGLNLEGPFQFPSLSPDGRKATVPRVDPQTRTPAIWLLDLARGSASRFTFGTGMQQVSVWAPDGSKVAYSAMQGAHTHYDLYWKDTNGVGGEELLLESGESKHPTDWSHDGRYILYQEADPKTKWDLWALPMFGDRKPILLLRTEFDETFAEISPDGRWMVYQSNESGREEIYVRCFQPGSAPTSGGKWQISTNGGRRPGWRRDGKELFFVSPDRKLMSAAVKPGASFEAGLPVPLFDIQSRMDSFFLDARADGQQFLVSAPTGEAVIPVNVCLNWLAGAKK